MPFLWRHPHAKIIFERPRIIIIFFFLSPNISTEEWIDNCRFFAWRIFAVSVNGLMDFNRPPCEFAPLCVSSLKLYFHFLVIMVQCSWCLRCKAALDINTNSCFQTVLNCANYPKTQTLSISFYFLKFFIFFLKKKRKFTDISCKIKYISKLAFFFIIIMFDANYTLLKCHWPDL